jgi:hypothetical protein
VALVVLVEALEALEVLPVVQQAEVRLDLSVEGLLQLLQQEVSWVVLQA